MCIAIIIIVQTAQDSSRYQNKEVYKMNPKQFGSDKILNHLNEVSEWYRGGNPFPITMELDLTNKCNHHCPGCVGGRHNNEELSEKEAATIIYELDALGCKGLIFTGGGEPLCSPHVIKAVEYAGRSGMDVGFITNGSLLHKIDCKTLLDCCTWIRISLDAGSYTMHKKVHGTNDFAEVVKNIGNLTSLKDKIESSCTVGTGYLTGKGTDDPEDMMDFVCLSIELQVDYAQFRPFLRPDDKLDFSDFKRIDFTPYFKKETEKTKILYSKHKYDSMKNGEVKRVYDKCYGQQFASVISAAGDMVVCCHGRGGNPSMYLGNIKKQTIKEIWGSVKRQKIVESIQIEKCPLLCRADTFNTILWNIKQKKEHINFL